MTPGTGRRYAIGAGLVLGAGVLLYLLKPVLMPFLVGAMLAYMGNPAAQRLERLGMGRTWAVTLVFFALMAVVVLVIVLMVPLLEDQISIFAAYLPDYVDRLQHIVLPWVQTRLAALGIHWDVDNLRRAVAEHWQQLGAGAADLVATVTRSGVAVLSWFVNLVLIPVVAFYLLRDWNTLLERLRALVPRRAEPVVVRLAHECDQVLGNFLRGQLLVMLALGLIYSIGLWLTGLDIALLIGIGAGLLSIVPFMGTTLGVIVAAIATFAQFQDVQHLWSVGLVFVVGQFLEGWVLSPWLVGDRIGLHPLGVIFAVMAGGQLFGFFGVLLALPLAAVVMVLLRYAHERYTGSALYQDRGTE